MRSTASEQRVNEVRSFNRFWTKHIGVLGDGFLETSYSLSEARLLFELAQREATEVVDLRNELGLDGGYLSRILSTFKAAKLVTTQASEADGRRQVVRLTSKGRKAFETLDARSREKVGAVLAGLGEEDQGRLVGAMASIRGVLDGTPRASSCVLRPLEPGDLGWIVERHGALYAEEYGWDDTFEALVARIVSDYVGQRDPRKDNAWIAEVDGERAGCMLCVKKNVRTAQLRLLLIEPRTRGMGIGTRLVDECIRFAIRAGYEQMTLWTNHPLKAARRIYERAGFGLVEEEKHHSFGHDLVGQSFALDLTGLTDRARRASDARVTSSRAPSTAARAVRRKP